MLRSFLDWVDGRTGFVGGIRQFLNQDIPASSGWHQVFGSVALFAFLAQAVSGILLAFNYTPTPGEAYNSLRHIITEVTGGRFIRAMHHWGASMMIVVVVLHMIQTFLWSGYKKPREVTWVTGVVLLLLTFTFVLSGYLLPGDNQAYWSTIVITQISGLAPVSGPYLLKLFGTDGTNIGPATFARFYTAHVILLPSFIALLMALHIYLVRRHGITPAPDDEAKSKKQYYPAQIGRETVAVFLWFVVLLAAAAFARVPLGRMADPADLSYAPRPEWYFLFLSQFLHFFDGPLEVVGAVILPTLAILALLALPFVDRTRMVYWRRRVGAVILVCLSVFGWGGLTARAVLTTPKFSEIDMTSIQPWQEISAGNLASIGYFMRAGCGTCHIISLDSTKAAAAGPDLSLMPSEKSPEWLAMHFNRPAQNASPPQLTNFQIQMLVTFVTRRTGKEVEAWANTPQPIIEGAMLFQANDCGSCHKLNGVGDELGPPLDGIGERRDRAWIEEHFRDPAKLSPDTIMPAFPFTAKDMKLITDYIIGIPR